jgi:hypothetical protein
VLLHVVFAVLLFISCLEMIDYFVSKLLTLLPITIYQLIVVYYCIRWLPILCYRQKAGRNLLIASIFIHVATLGIWGSWIVKTDSEFKLVTYFVCIPAELLACMRPIVPVLKDATIQLYDIERPAGDKELDDIESFSRTQIQPNQHPGELKELDDTESFSSGPDGIEKEADISSPDGTESFSSRPGVSHQHRGGGLNDDRDSFSSRPGISQKHPGRELNDYPESFSAPDSFSHALIQLNLQLNQHLGEGTSAQDILDYDVTDLCRCLQGKWEADDYAVLLVLILGQLATRAPVPTPQTQLHQYHELLQYLTPTDTHVMAMLRSLLGFVSVERRELIINKWNLSVCVCEPGHTFWSRCLDRNDGKPIEIVQAMLSGAESPQDCVCKSQI